MICHDAPCSKPESLATLRINWAGNRIGKPMAARIRLFSARFIDVYFMRYSLPFECGAVSLEWTFPLNTNGDRIERVMHGHNQLLGLSHI